METGRLRVDPSFSANFVLGDLHELFRAEKRCGAVGWFTWPIAGFVVILHFNIRQIPLSGYYPDQRRLFRR